MERETEREREMLSLHLPFSCAIPGRHQDESKLCLTNTLVLFSLHGELAEQQIQYHQIKDNIFS